MSDRCGWAAVWRGFCPRMTFLARLWMLIGRCCLHNHPPPPINDLWCVYFRNHLSVLVLGPKSNLGATLYESVYHFRTLTLNQIVVFVPILWLESFPSVCWFERTLRLLKFHPLPFLEFLLDILLSACHRPCAHGYSQTHSLTVSQLYCEASIFIRYL